MLRHDVDRYEPPPDRLRHVQLVLAEVALGDTDINTAEPREVAVAATALREVLEVLDLLRST